MRRRIGQCVVFVVAIAVTLTGCTDVTSGRDVQARGPAASATSGATSPAPTGTSPSTTPSSVSSAPAASAARVRTAAQLVRALETPPARSTPWRDSWSRTVHVTAQQFVDHVYMADYRAIELAALQSQGLRTVAHRTWYAIDADQVDDVLLQFGSQDGAQSRLLRAVNAKQGVPGIVRYGIPGTEAVAFYRRTLDSLGNVAAVVYARVGTVVVELFYYSPSKFSPRDATTWTKAQLARLR